MARKARMYWGVSVAKDNLPALLEYSPLTNRPFLLETRSAANAVANLTGAGAKVVRVRVLGK